MPTPVKLEIGPILLRGRLEDSPAAKALENLLPVFVRMTRWGDEYYGTLLPPLGEHVGEKVEVLEIGDLAYWAPGDALCLFFGPTPVSREGEPRAASPVHKLGNVSGDWERVKLLGEELDAVLDFDGENL